MRALVFTLLTHHLIRALRTCASARLRVLPIVIACLTQLGTLGTINMRLHAFTLKHFSFQFFTRLTLHGITNQYLNRETGIKYLQFSSYTLFLKATLFFNFSTQPQCCLTFLWIELQMLLRYCLIHISVSSCRHTFYVCYICAHV